MKDVKHLDFPSVYSYWIRLRSETHFRTEQTHSQPICTLKNRQ